MNREAEICADMNAAEGAAQASLAGSGAAVIQGNAPSALDELSRLDADVLILVDLVADASRRVELIERPALFAAFREKAAAAPIPKAHDLLEDADRQMDSTYNRAPGTVSFVPPKTKNREEREANRLKVPTLRDQREAFTRRELLRGLLEGRLAETAQALERENAAAEAPKPKRRLNSARLPKSTSIRWWTLRSPVTAASQTSPPGTRRNTSTIARSFRPLMPAFFRPKTIPPK